MWDRRFGYQLSPSPGGSGVLGSSVSPSLELKNVIDPKSTIWSVRFAKSKRGCLGVLSNAGHFKAYDVIKEFLTNERKNDLTQEYGPNFLEKYPEEICTKSIRDVCVPYNHPTRGCSESERVVSFDFRNNNSPQEPNAITLTGNGDVCIARLMPPAAPIHLSSHGLLVCGRGPSSQSSDFKTVSPLSGRNSTISETVDEIRKHTSSPSPLPKPSHLSEKRDYATNPLSSREARERLLSTGTLGKPIRAEQAVTLLTVNRLRCKEGYLFDPVKNKHIVADDERLQGFWDWVESRFLWNKRRERSTC